jgi:hypothetical protein
MAISRDQVVLATSTVESVIGTNRTSRQPQRMSAYDPKRTYKMATRSIRVRKLICATIGR